MQDIRNFNDDEYVVIDLTTGTVLGTNLVMAPWPKDAEVQENILTSDDEAVNYADRHGIPIMITE